MTLRRSTRLRTSALVGALGTAVGVAGSLVAAHVISGPRRPAHDFGFTPFEVGAHAEDVTFHATDGTRLAGWWFAHEDAIARGAEPDVVVVSHGYRGTKQDMLGIGPGLWRAGFEVLLYDFRGNGASEDGPQSLAHYEQQDLDAALALVRARRPGARVHLLGFSMGAAVSILVAARDTGIVSVVADSAFADMRGVIAHAVANLHLPSATVPLVDLATGARYGYRFREVAPVDAVGAIAPRPLLLLHGTEDSVIPVEHALRLAEAAGAGSELHLTEGAAHCGTYFADRPGYIARVAAFLGR